MRMLHPLPHLQVTSEQAACYVEEVKGIDPGPYLREWITRYEAVGHRKRFLWLWAFHTLHRFTLSCVAPELRESLIQTKVLSIMSITLIDDIADKDQDSAALERACRVVQTTMALPRLSGIEPEQPNLALLRSLYAEISTRIQSSPRFDALGDFLRFDLEQALNAMRYSLLINRVPAAFSLLEHDVYSHHGMLIMYQATLDLCCSPGFAVSDLGSAREAFWHSQHMGRIGNMLFTWEREAHQGDFSSGVFAHALSAGTLAASDLKEMPVEDIIRVIRSSPSFTYFVSSWTQHRMALQDAIQRINSVDLSSWLQANDDLWRSYASARGLL